MTQDQYGTPYGNSPQPSGATPRALSQRIATRETTLGDSMIIRRALPQKNRRMVGAWCFLDHFGPVDVSRGDGLRVGPHPHIGLQTFTWPLEGEILHRDSLGYVQLIRPGQVNLMTAGRGISHSEESPQPHPPRLHGLQLWIALPESQRFCEPAFEHYPELPVVERDGFRITVLVGEALGQLAPTRVYSPLVALDLHASGPGNVELPLRSDFEHALLVAQGEVLIRGEEQPLGPGTLLYLGAGRGELALRADAPARLLLIGGEPFAEDILMWWNFVARSRAEIDQATRDWNMERAYGSVQGYPGPRLQAPLPPWRNSEPF